MPASRRTKVDEHDVEDYRQKRKRNNEAVKRSREKANIEAQGRKQRVDKLVAEITELDTTIKQTKSNIGYLLNVFKDLAVQRPEVKEIVRKILADGRMTGQSC